MARKTLPLSDTKIDKAKSTDKDQKLYDGDGLIIIIKPYKKISIISDDGTSKEIILQGSKLWRFKYQFNGKQNTLSIGKYPETSLFDARSLSMAYRVLLAKGIDPSAKRKNAKAEIKLNATLDKEKEHNLLKYVLQDFLIFKSHTISLGQVDRYQSRMKHYILPALGEKVMEDITDSDVIDCIKNVSNIVTPKSHKAIDNKAETSRRVFDICKQLWKWAKANKRTPINIMLEIEIKEIIPPSKGNRHYAKITDEKILGELLRAIAGYQHSKIVRNAMRLVSILPYRVENLTTLRWEMIDFDKRLLTIPRPEMKITDPSLPDFVLPLPAQAIQILQETQEMTSWGKWVFHGIKDFENHMNEETCNKALRLMGFTDESKGYKQTTHSFRGTFRSLSETYAKEHMASFETRERVLDHHENNKAVRAYTHMANYTEQMRPLLQWWADFLDKTKEKKG